MKLAALYLAGSEFLEQPLRHGVELPVDVGELGGGAGLCEPHKINQPKQMRTSLGTPPQFTKFVCGKKLYNYDSLEPSERKLVL